MEASLNPFSELGNIDFAFIEFHSRVLRYGKTLLACLFGFKIREAFLLTEELDESGIQISECGLQRKRVDLGKPMKFLRLLHLGQICLNVKTGKISLVFLISLDFLVESIVIDKPTTSEVLSQKHFLLLVRVQPIFVCSIFHATKIIIILETTKENSKKISGNSSTEAKDLGDFLPISFKIQVYQVLWVFIEMHFLANLSEKTVNVGVILFHKKRRQSLQAVKPSYFSVSSV